MTAKVWQNRLNGYYAGPQLRGSQEAELPGLRTQAELGYEEKRFDPSR